METVREHIAKMAAFADHPHIRPLAERPQWTISDKDKKPIDMLELEVYGRIRGCDRDIPYSTRTLDEVRAMIPDASNFAFYLDSDIDGVIVADVEPECPDELKQVFLAAPRLYGEVSMSGKGYHLLLPYPTELMRKYPAACMKTVMKDKARGFEFLFEHWVTFTANQLPEKTDGDIEPVLALLDELAEKQEVVDLSSVTVDSCKPGAIPFENDILSNCNQQKVRVDRLSPSMYDGDLSRYEFACACTVLRLIKTTQSTLAEYELLNGGGDVSWDDTQTAWLAYSLLADWLPYRDKHDEIRTGLPWLLYVVRNAMMRM